MIGVVYTNTGYRPTTESLYGKIIFPLFLIFRTIKFSVLSLQIDLSLHGCQENLQKVLKVKIKAAQVRNR